MHVTGWKTRMFGTLLIIFGAIQTADFSSIIPPEYIGIFTSIVGVVVLVLRQFTSTPAGQAK